MSKILTAMLADTPLVRNLDNTNYMAILLKGKESLAERFADIDIEQVRQEKQDNNNRNNRFRKYQKTCASCSGCRNYPKKS